MNFGRTINFTLSMKKSYITLALLSLFIAFACTAPEPNVDSSGEDELESLEIEGRLNKKRDGLSGCGICAYLF